MVPKFSALGFQPLKRCSFGAVAVVIVGLTLTTMIGCPPPDEADPPPPPNNWPPPLALTILPTPPLPDPLPTPPDVPQNVRLTQSLLMEQGDGGSQSFLGADKVVVSNDGKFVFASVNGDNPNATVEVYERDTKSLNVTFVQSFLAMIPFEAAHRPLTHPRAIKISPDGNYLLVAGESVVEGTANRNHLASLLIDSGDGTLSLADGETFSNPSGIPKVLVVSPDSKDVYVFGNTPARHFRLDPSTGALTEIDPQILSGRNDHVGAISPDGRHIYIEGQFPACEESCFEGRRLTYERDLTTGELSLIANVTFGASTTTSPILISSDGKFVYAQNGSALGIYARNALTGELTLQPGMPPSIDDAAAFSPSGDGLLVYDATGPRLSFYAYDSSTGALTFVSSAEIGLTVDPLTTVPFGALAFTPDAQTIYAAGSSTFAEFSRSVPGNQLALIAYEQFGTGSVKGLANLLSGTVSSDGNHMYFHGFQPFKDPEPANGTLVVYDREGADATLTRRALTQAGIFGAFGFYGQTMSMSPTGDTVMLADFDDCCNGIYGIQGDPFGEVMSPSFSSSFDRVTDFAFTPDGLSFYAFADFARFQGSEGVVLFNVGAGVGDITESTTFNLREAIEPNPGSERGHAPGPQILIDASGNDLYNAGWYRFTGQGPDPIFADLTHIKRNAETNDIATTHFYLMLEFVESATPPLGGMAMSADGKNIYVVVNTQPFNSIQIVDRNPADGALDNFRAWRGGIDSASGPTDAQQIRVSPNGLHVLILEQEPVDAMNTDGPWITRIFRFNRSTATGDLDLDEIFETQDLDPAAIPDTMPFLVSDPDDAEPVVYVGAGSRILGLDLN